MKIILGIAGEIASGKGTVAKHIEEKHNGSSHRFSTALRDVARRMHLEESRENLQKISSIFRQNFNDDILSMVVCKDVEMDTHQIVAIDGVRRMADIKCLKNFVADHQREAESQIADFKNYADFVVNNEGTFLELYHQVDQIISGLNK